MAGAAHGPGFNPHLPGFKHHFLGKALGATMWFFIFYRIRQDGSAKLLAQHSFGHGHGSKDLHHP